MQQLISLVGLPASGKSTIGRKLAQQLSQPFFDLDDEVEREAGMAVPRIFEARGEAGFREIEAAVCERLLDLPAGVIATGGGCVIHPDNRALLARRSTVVYLHSRPDVIARRVRPNGRRPLFDGVDVGLKMNELYTLRDPLYRAVAHLVVEVDPRVKHMALAVENELRRHARCTETASSQ